MAGRVFNFTAGGTTVLLVACPLRNLLSLRECFGMPGVVMDVPAPEIRFETELLALQVCLAALAGLALFLGAQARRSFRVGAGLAWSLVALGGYAWDKALWYFVGETLSANSAYGCLRNQRSAHTHTMLTNGPLLLAAGLALSLWWKLYSSRPPSGDRPGVG